MFIVVHGYCGPDRYTADCGPVLELTISPDVSGVLQLRKEFEENTGGDRDISHCIFRVFEGVERRICEKTRVTEYDLA